jgi:hypothetical protein
MHSVVWIRRGFYVFVGLLFVYAVLGMFFTGPVVVRVPRLDLDVDPRPDRLRQDVERLCSEFAPRSFDHTANLDRAAGWIAAEMRSAGLRVDLQDYELEEGRFRNVIGIRPGREPDSGAIVVGAHYDAVPGSPGANDNASGVAVLLELARTLPDVHPRRTHYFVAFSTEEPPFFDTDRMGSHRFARRLADQGVDVVLALSLDLVGYYSEESGSQEMPSPLFRLFYPRQGNFVAVIGDARSGPAIGRVKRGLRAAGHLPVHSFRAPLLSGLVHLSDHRSFRKHGMPAVLVTDTAFLRYDAYHRPDDTPDRLDYERMAALVRGLHGVLWE